jgi:hypothetical protein
MIGAKWHETNASGFFPANQEEFVRLEEGKIRKI